MDLTSIFLFCVISLVIGAVLMILVQYYVFVKYFNEPTSEADAMQRNRSLNERYQLPDAVLASIQSPEIETRIPTTAFNLIFQFLFFELRNANKVRKWFHRKLSLELDELISKTTTGKLFEKLSVRDLDLGAQFPEIRNIKVVNTDLHENGHLDGVELLLDIDYRGNFHISIDADMVLGKKGSLSIKVNHISGLVRLHYTRLPYTHWSLCFIDDPVIELDIETQFLGRYMSQSNVTSLISNQIRKAIRRKHTFPNYKLRYKPFFHRAADEDIDLNEVQLSGCLDVNIAELTRLQLPPDVGHVYCTVTIAPMPWVTAQQYDDTSILCSFDIEIHRAKNQQLGIVFKQIKDTILIDTILPNTPAMKAELCKDDVLISIEGKKVQNINHITKILKSINRPAFKLRIERIVGGVLHNDSCSVEAAAMPENAENGESEEKSFGINYSKNADSVQIQSKCSRQSSSEKSPMEGVSQTSTPTSTPSKSKDDAGCKLRYRGICRNNSDKSSGSEDIKPTTPLKMPVKFVKNDSDGEYEYDGNVFESHTTSECSVNSFINLNDACQFKLNAKSLYLNLNVLGKCRDDTVLLLAYLNIPMQNILYECSDTTLAHFIKQYSLNPPETPDLSSHTLSSSSGFDPNFCFGDVLLSFSWNDTNPTSNILSTPSKAKSSAKLSSSTEKLADTDPRLHNFIRKHFQSSTQCDYCGRKIWLKDGVQCQECLMNCHKKCISKCQSSTICGPVTIQTSAVGFHVTDTDADGNGEIDDFEENDETVPKLDQHRQSFSEMISQGIIKRVNSANNLAIPAIIQSSLNQGSRSLPPSPQHTPRKQSLCNPSSNPFVDVIQKLDQLPNHIDEITREQIVAIAEPLIGICSHEEMMEMAKDTSRSLFADIEPNERIELIDNLLTKIRLALDSETTAHANLVASLNAESRERNSASAESTPRKSKENGHDLTRKAILIAQSEERVHALSSIMLHLCTGLQNAQGVATN